jgi:hypothetical protein
MHKIQESLGKYGNQKEVLDDKKNIIIKCIKDKTGVQLKNNELEISGDIITIISNSVVRAEISKSHVELIPAIKKEGIEIRKMR